MGPQPLIKQAGQLINELGSDGVSARLLGGVAVALRCPVASPPSPLARSYSDVDIAITRTSRRVTFAHTSLQRTTTARGTVN